MDRRKYFVSRLIGLTLMEASIAIMLYINKAEEVLITTNQLRDLFQIYLILILTEVAIREIIYKIKSILKNKK